MPTACTKEHFMAFLSARIHHYSLAENNRKRNEIVSDIMGFLLVNVDTFLCHFRTFSLFTVIKQKCDEFLQDPNANDSLREICTSLLAKLDETSG